jgi:hypothetical protein
MFPNYLVRFFQSFLKNKNMSLYWASRLGIPCFIPRASSQVVRDWQSHVAAMEQIERTEFGHSVWQLKIY